jgi:TolA-binding protein
MNDMEKAELIWAKHQEVIARADKAEADLADLIDDMESLSDINNELNSDIAALVEALERIRTRQIEAAVNGTTEKPVDEIVDEALKNHGERGQQIMAVVEVALKAAGSGYATQDRLALNNALAELDK